MTRSIIIGTGPAAAGAALALASDPAQQITVLDIGHRLEEAKEDAVQRLASTECSAWDEADVSLISKQPMQHTPRGLPQKLSYGSDYPFKNMGQLDDVTAAGDINDSVISGAYGGLSNVWGSQVMAFTPATFSDWPITSAEMETHYRKVLAEIPYAAEEDALARQFPLLSHGEALPQLAPRTRSVIAAAQRNQNALDRIGITVGRARLAFDAPACVRCGLCMTGCPYSLIYSSAHTFDRLRLSGRVDYHDNLLATEVGHGPKLPYLLAREPRSSAAIHRFEADRIYVACGAVGTTRLVLGSLRLFDQDVELLESVQFVLPMLSRHPTPDPSLVTEFTLNQFNMVVTTDDTWHDLSQIHFYPHNDAILEGLPPILRTHAAARVTNQLLRRLTVGLGYLPSWVSPRFRVKAERPTKPGLPGLVLSGDVAKARQIPMFRQVISKVLRAAPLLDLWPVLPMLFFSAPAKSYHFGGSFPHGAPFADGPLTTDRLGRLERWPGIHIVDASVFPTIPATTFTLTIMANAHRIATESLRLEA